MVMVNVEADVMVGPFLAQKARAQGVCYSMAYGEQPALVSEMVAIANACGLDVPALGLSFPPCGDCNNYNRDY